MFAPAVLALYTYLVTGVRDPKIIFQLELIVPKVQAYKLLLYNIGIDCLKFYSKQKKITKNKQTKIKDTLN